MSGVDDGLTLVADIGGTNLRLGLSRRGAASVLEADSVRIGRGAEQPSLIAALESYLREQGVRPTRAVLAVAAPLLDDHVQFTNSAWSFSRTELGRALGLRHLRVVNDFAAMSAAVPELPATAFCPIGAVAPCSLTDGAARIVAILGPGTGLGVGLLLRRDGRSLIVDTEGGHVGFAPTSALEVEIWRRFVARHGRVSNERLVSGPGLAALHHVLGEIDGVAVHEVSPEQVLAGARAGQRDCLRTVECFVAILGGVAGDVALATGARDGVYLAGGLVAPLLPWLRSGLFRRRFDDKGRVAATVRGAPTVALLHEHIGLLGAGAIASSDRVALARGD